jgi:hypothetical protein
VLTDRAREQRRDAATTHGAHSERQIVRRAASEKRRLLRQIGLRAKDLEGLGLALLDNWARCQSKVALLDDHFASVGFLDGEGEPVPATRIYFTAVNSARLALQRLEDHLRSRQRDDAGELARYLAATYGDRKTA